ncbi:YhcN/YlaJ family sporulation lipoprotein [Caldalkalibacillus thermarum]|uniref:YhcN/YlaJ family sporulation lipoprotein n=1 Tax=Caldalkalibacillus thermarum TaxID=296745 RepID=UPI0016683146|nr:YhcN/YlaJ family sporulation lipoprotein [Caldalkalibacillus thermarum]
MKKLCRFSRALGSGILMACWIVLLFNAGCAMYNQEQPFQADYKLQQQMDKKGSKPHKIKVDHDTANRSKLIAKSVEGVTDAAAVAIDQELSVAVDVAQMKRFQLKGIRKEIFHRLRKAYPEYQVHVSTDRKILQELKKLEKKTYQQQTEAEQKRLQKINQDMKG